MVVFGTLSKLQSFDWSNCTLAHLPFWRS